MRSGKEELMRITVKQLAIHDAPLIFDFVLRLLMELGDEGDDLGDLKTDKVLTQWRADEDRIFTFVAHDEAIRVVGLLTLVESFAIYENGNHGIINEMYVDPEKRSGGVGKLLLDAAQDFGRQRGWSRIDVTAPESPRWARSRAFYESCGFTFAGPKFKLTL